ncbi:AI-2E family transporter [Halobacteria archaeon AArc-curdl1]|uniref:AI-2E family transporter n=1 Tax=Natronosalvus hydrolyticus TaxID=2979988 RepID=A0AAP2ZCE3_9EURY|nr:AI-2E family transporter [Halobacteria archaeon AArc-curdl1]
MSPDRRYVLGGIVVLLGLVTGAILLEVLGTILFALTVAYVLIPVSNWLERRGLTPWLSAVGATIVGFLGALAVFAPIFVTLYLRRGELLDFIQTIPDEVPIVVPVVESTITLESAEVQRLITAQVQDIALSVGAAAPELAIKFALFVLLLFGLLLKGDAAGRAAIAPVPHEYRDIVGALDNRARETLYAIYVLQAGTSVATLLIGYPLFLLLGYDSAFTLAFIAALLQFVPIIGPSLLIVPLAALHVTMGEIGAAILVAVLGIGLVAWFPDVAVRPRLARRSVGLPGSLYFVGFTGGLFTLGAIGIVVGPLIVAVFVESVDLLSAEVNGEVTLSDFHTPDGEGDDILTEEGDDTLAYEDDDSSGIDSPSNGSDGVSASVIESERVDGHFDENRAGTSPTESER